MLAWILFAVMYVSGFALMMSAMADRWADWWQVRPVLATVFWPVAVWAVLIAHGIEAIPKATKN